MPRSFPRLPDSPASERPAPARQAFEALRRKAVEAADQGRFQDAYDLLGEALEQARSLGDPDLVDRAVCGRAAAALELGGESQVGQLREILVRNSDEENCFLAAYTISRAYDLEREYRKALFYARIGRDYAQRLARQDWLGSSHNLIANLLLATSFFDEACREYETALELLPEDALLERAVISDSVGYCRVVRGKVREGFGLLFRSLRTLRRLSARRAQGPVHLSLSFAYLEIGRYHDAVRHGFRALEIGESEGDTDGVKNALYLLGQAASLAGERMLARRFFARLQAEFCPGEGSLAELLLAVDARGLINLKA